MDDDTDVLHQSKLRYPPGWDKTALPVRSGRPRARKALFPRVQPFINRLDTTEGTFRSRTGTG